MATIGFIGTGNMGGALAIAAGKVGEGDVILLYDRDKQAAQRVSHAIAGSRVTTENVLLQQADVVFIGVKPHMLAGLFDEINEKLEARKDDPPVLVSMAAGVSISKIRAYSRELCPVVRIMPNVPVSVGAGLVMVSRDENVSDEDFAEVGRILSKAGEILPIGEQLIDAGSALSGCGPAFVAMFLEALVDGGVACGLPRDTAAKLSVQTLLGTAQLQHNNSVHPGILKATVCSPGGTTIEGVRTLEERAFRGAVMDAVIASYEKTLKLGK